MNSELSNPEKFVGSLYPRKFESDKYIAINFNYQNQSKNHKIRLVESRLCFMYRQSLCETVQCKRRRPERQGIRIFLRIRKLLLQCEQGLR